MRFLLRQSKQAAFMKILNGKNTLIKKLVSDGVLVSTLAGSTAYNYVCSWSNIKFKFKKNSKIP